MHIALNRFDAEEAPRTDMGLQLYGKVKPLATDVQAQLALVGHPGEGLPMERDVGSFDVDVDILPFFFFFFENHRLGFVRREKGGKNDSRDQSDGVRDDFDFRLSFVAEIQCNLASIFKDHLFGHQISRRHGMRRFLKI